MNETSELLQRYARTGCETAFRELVDRHVGLVYSVALRKVAGDTHLARDIAQTVFTDLARKARSLPSNVVLAGWLWHHTGLKAAECVRGESRRRRREQIAVEMSSINQSDHDEHLWREVAPVLDEEMRRLNDGERNALVLRFFQNASLRAIGDSLGISEDAAQKRIVRALDRLRLRFNRLGVTCTAGALGSCLNAYAGATAPAGLAASVSSSALASVAATVVPGAGGSLIIKSLIVMSKAKAVVIGALVLGAATTFTIYQQRENSRLRQLLASRTQTPAAAPETNTTQEQSVSTDQRPAQSTSQSAAVRVISTPRSVREIMQEAISLAGRAQAREQSVKEIEPLLAQITVGDLKQAADLALGIADRSWRTGFLHMLLRRWAAEDGPAALNYFVQNVKGDAQAPLLAGVLPVWAERDPEAAWQWFQTARQDLQFDAQGRQNSAIKETFYAMARTGFESTLGHVRELEGIDMLNAFIGLSEGAHNQQQRLQLLATADALPDAKWRQESRKSILSIWAGLQPDETRAYVEALTDPVQRSQSAQFVGPVLMGTDPETAAQWWLSQTSESDRSAALKEIVRTWTESDMVGAAKWLQTLGNAPDADVAKTAFAGAAMFRAPESAMSWASSIGDGERRLQTQRQVYRIWHGQNAAQAEQWLANANLSADAVSEITRQ